MTEVLLLVGVPIDMARGAAAVEGNVVACCVVVSLPGPSLSPPRCPRHQVLAFFFVVVSDVALTVVVPLRAFCRCMHVTENRIAAAPVVGKS